MASYLLIVHDERLIGVGLNLICQILLVPFAYQHKAWDMIGLSGLFGGIDVHIIVGMLL